jgi:hypothetical protein
MQKPQNFIEVVKLREAGVPAAVAHGEFLDAFYRASKKRRMRFLAAEPPASSVLPKFAYALFAAMAEKLAHDNNLPAPSWVLKPQYKLSKSEASWGGLTKPSTATKALLKKQTPQEFAKRNIFVTANILERV